MKNSGRLLPTKPNTAEHCNISKLAIKRHLDIDLLDDIIRKLASSEQLPEKNKDHALTGNWVGHHECHIQPDWLLVYRIENDLLVLTLSRTGTHSVKSLYFVSVHLMQKQQKPDIRFPQDAYAKTHNYVSAGSIEPFI